MKVLHFTHTINKYDFIDNVIRHLDKSEFEPSVLTLTENATIADTEYLKEGIEHSVIEYRRRRDFFKVALKVRKYIKLQKIEIIHSHHFEPTLLACAATIFLPSVKLIIGRQYADEIYLLTSGLKRQILLLLEAIVNRRASLIIVPSKPVRDLLVDKQSVNSRKVVVAHYPLDPEKYAEIDFSRVFKLRSSILGDARADSVLIGTFSRLHWEKGHKYLLEAISLLCRSTDKFLCIIIGDGPEMGKIQADIEVLGIRDYVRLLGWRTDVPDLIAACDIVVHPSLHESFCQVMVEAMWQSKPFVVTNVPGPSDIIEDGISGLLVPLRNSERLADGILRLMENSELRQDMGEEAKRRIRNTLSLSATIPVYESAYRLVYYGPDSPQMTSTC